MKNHWFVVLFGVLAAGCSGDPDPSTGASGGNVFIADAFPEGAVSFFNRLECPPDWSPFEAAAGRAIVAANAGLPSGMPIGDRLSSGEDRVHVHNLKGSVNVTSMPNQATEPGPNGLFISGGDYPFAGTSNPASAGVPYRQLLVCRKMVGPKPDALPLPAKLHIHFDRDACPSGWKEADPTKGRILVGLPKGGAADMPMGGDPLTSSTPRTHTHTYTSTLVPTPLGNPQSIGVASVGLKGSYPFMGESDPAADGFPMVALVHCAKQ